MIILIPPSEGKAEGGSGAKKVLHAVTKEILKDLKTADPKKVYTARIEEAAALNAKVASAKTMAAIERYTGVVYKAFDYATLSAKGKKYADTHLLISSGLFGLVSPQESIPNYKFSIGKLKAASRWKEHNTELIKGKFVIDLLPDAHKKSVAYEDGVVVEFIRMHKGKEVRSGHAGKHIKGRFLRWLCEQQVRSVEEFTGFTEEGYKWDGEVFRQ